jgi:hypothetical protein
MFWSVTRWLPVFAATLYACGMGLLWAETRMSVPPVIVSPGDPGAYIATALLGVAVMMTIAARERRIHQLERRLRENDRRASPPAAPDPPAPG